jgi:hypothetical protein
VAIALSLGDNNILIKWNRTAEKNRNNPKITGEYYTSFSSATLLFFQINTAVSKSRRILLNKHIAYVVFKKLNTYQII